MNSATSSTGQEKMGAGAEEDENNAISLTQLPFKVLEKIVTLLDYQNALNLRLTCSVLKKVVDSGTGLLFEFSEDPMHPDLKKQLEFIKDIRIVILIANQILGEEGDSDGVRRYFNQEYAFDDLLCFPKLLVLALMGKTHAQFLFDALSKCQNLNRLCLQSKDFVLVGSLLPLLITKDAKEDEGIIWDERSDWLYNLSKRNNVVQQIKLPKLRWLSIHNPDPEGGNFLCTILLLTCIRSDELKRVHLDILEIKDFTEMEYFHFSMIVADFLQAHNETLKEFELKMDPSITEPVSDAEFEETLSNTFNKQLQLGSNVLPGDHGDSVDPKSRMLVILRRKLEAIGKVSKLMHLNITIFPNFHWDFWLVYIENLRKLITLHFVASTKHSILKNCSFIKNSSKTLKRFRMQFDILNDFDFSGIEDCENLEEVYLFHTPHLLRRSSLGSSGKLPGVTNAKLIPGGLKTLCLGYLVTLTEDLNSMLSNQKDLETLVIVGRDVMSHTVETGPVYMISTQLNVYPDCKCFKKIFRMRSLQSCLIQSFRGKTKKTYTRILEMLDFQLDPRIREIINEWNSRHSHNLKYFPVLVQKASLNIVSTEVRQPYIWEQRGNNLSYVVGLNDKKDPYFPYS